MDIIKPLCDIERAIWQVFVVAVRVIFVYHLAKFLLMALIVLLTVL